MSVNLELLDLRAFLAIFDTSRGPFQITRAIGILECRRAFLFPAVLAGHFAQRRLI